MMVNKYILTILFLCVTLLVTGVSAYTIKLPVCTDAVNTSCVNVGDATGTTNSATPAVIFFQNGNVYISNDIPQNYSTINNYNYTNFTTINQAVTNVTYITYVFNMSNGSTYSFQYNYSLNNSYVYGLFEDVYSHTNFSNFYNRSYIDNQLALKSDISNIQNSLASYLPRGDFEARWASLNNLNNLNNINWTGFNLTKINDHVNNTSDEGGFSLAWKVAIVIIGILVLGIAIMMVRSMME